MACCDQQVSACPSSNLWMLQLVRIFKTGCFIVFVLLHLWILEPMSSRHPFVFSQNAEADQSKMRNFGISAACSVHSQPFSQSCLSLSKPSGAHRQWQVAFSAVSLPSSKAGTSFDLRTTLTERVLFYTGRIQAIHEANCSSIFFLMDQWHSLQRYADLTVWLLYSFFF